MSHDPLADLGEPDAVAGGMAEAVEAEGADPDRLAVSLPSSLTIADVAEVHADLMATLDSQSEWTLDASDVEVIDGSGIQLLAALSKAAEQRQARLAWSGVSAVVTAAADQLGLTGVLRLDGNPGHGGA